MKKLNLQKIIGIILCLLAVSLIGFILFFSADFRASRKVLDKYMTALKSNNTELISNCSAPDLKDDLSKLIKSESSEEKEFKSVSYKIKDKKQNNNAFIFKVKASVFFSDDTSNKSEFTVTMLKINKKWYVSSIEQF